ncbi:hypothetical protein SPI_00419 [Niveomyces insectorum RCEF 264]|uniref:Uncharacterized protein n=1 Tax=Niveomyces insectorum RCEF 264 TaxID=1081102 RepID=A0A162LBH4_9HYPO|nr:hypothetical protein SPI_00419 [Niveomyces insectorum RCEF 264]
MPVHVLDQYYLGLTAIITVAYQLAFFFVAFALKFDKLTDFAGGSNFVVLAIVTLVLGSRGDDDGNPTLPPARQIVVSVLMCVWALRLAGFLLFRILRTGKDDRFDDKRDRFFPFLGFWVAQMVWVWTVSLPVTVLNAPAVQSRARLLPAFGTGRDVAGVVLFGVGFLSEAVADAQRFAFRARTQRQPQSRLAFCHTGLFAWSRHPNYFGEIVLQFGIYTIAASAAMATTPVGHRTLPFAPALNATVVGPIFLTLLLFFVSGMTLSERPSAAKRYAAATAAAEHDNHDDDNARRVWADYCDYLHRTSILVPLPPALYAPLPTWLKRTLLFEFPLYVFNPAKHADQAGHKNGGGDHTDPTGEHSADVQTLGKPPHSSASSAPSQPLTPR